MPERVTAWVPVSKRLSLAVSAAVSWLSWLSVADALARRVVDLPISSARMPAALSQRAAASDATSVRHRFDTAGECRSTPLSVDSRHRAARQFHAGYRRAPPYKSGPGYAAGPAWSSPDRGLAIQLGLANWQCRPRARSRPAQHRTRESAEPSGKTSRCTSNSGTLPASRLVRLCRVWSEPVQHNADDYQDDRKPAQPIYPAMQSAFHRLSAPGHQESHEVEAQSAADERGEHKRQKSHA